MQRSEGRSGASNTPTLAENQNSDSHHESQMEVQYCNIRMNMLKYTWILSLLLNFLKPNLFQANINLFTQTKIIFILNFFDYSLNRFSFEIF